jgi:iron complex outermembrane recepter protein
MKTFDRSTMALAWALASGAAMPDSMAQDAASPRGERALEEVVVTATKRETNLMDVPASVSVVSGELLTQLRANDVADLTQFVPNVSFQDGREAKIKAFNIRGIGTSTFNDGVEDSVGIVVDGVTLGRAAMGMYDLFDIQHVEVLRGPQGWLFGKSASAGVVNVVTKDPNRERFEADGTLSYGNHVRNEEWKFNGAVSGPITDQLAFRVAAYVDDRGGLVRDFYRNRDDHTKKQKAVRGKLLFQPTEEFSAKLSVDYLKEDNECCAEIPILAFAGGSLDQTVAPFFTIDDHNRNIAQNARSYNTNEVGGAALDLSYDIAGHTLTSITAFRTWDSFKTTDEDKTPVSFFDVTQTDTSNEQFTQEVRLASPVGKGRFDYLVGLHYYQQNLDSLEIFSANLGAATEQNRSVSPVRIDARSIGLFGSGTFHLTDAWRLIFGLRYTDDEIDGSVKHDEVGLVALFPEVDASESDSDSKVTGRIGVQYNPTDDVMLFATYGTGYKSAAFNAGTIQPANLPTQIVPGETSEMYELGMKSRWFDGRLQLNLTLFDTVFEDFQADAFVEQPGLSVPVLILSSVKELDTSGVEAEITARVTQGFLLGAALSYTDAKFEDFTNAPCYFRQTAAQGCVGGVQNLSGRQLPFQGEFQYNVHFNYDRSFGQWNLFAQGNYSWMDERDTIYTLDPRAKVDSLGLLSARLGVSLADDRFEVSLFGNNLTDEDYATKIRSSGLAGGYFRWAGIPRVIGVSATVRY